MAPSFGNEVFLLTPMDKMQGTLKEQYPDATVALPLAKHFSARTQKAQPMPSDFMILPPKFYDDTKNQQDSEVYPRIERYDPDFLLLIYTYRPFSDDQGSYGVCVTILETDTFYPYTVRERVPIGQHGENFGKAIQTLDETAESLRTAMRRTERLLELKTKGMDEAEKEFVHSYQFALTSGYYGKVWLERGTQFQIALKVAKEFLHQGMKAEDVERLLEEYAPYGGLSDGKDYCISVIDATRYERNTKENFYGV